MEFIYTVCEKQLRRLIALIIFQFVVSRIQRLKKQLRLTLIICRFPCPDVWLSSSGPGVGGSVPQAWSQSVGATTKLTSTLASWNRRTVGLEASAESPRSTTDLAGRRRGSKQEITCINRGHEVAGF